MVVECEGCGTRFNLPDGQVPPGGARVRCSKCHHRFVVIPEGAPAPEEDSSAHGKSGADEPDLDNPEFIFDDDDSSAEDEDEDAPSPDLDQTMRTDSDDDSFAESDDEEEGDDEDDEEDSAPSLPAPSGPAPSQVTATEAMELARSGEASDDPDSAQDGAQFGTGDGMLGTAAPASETDPTFGEQEQAPSPPASSGETASEMDSFGSDWDSDDDDDDADSWDKLLDGDAPVGSRDEGASAGPTRQRTAPARAKPAAPTPAPDDTPRLAGEIVDRASQVLAVAAGILLSIGGLRAVSQPSLGPTPGPEIVRGAGWAAEQIESAQLRDAAGRRVVVVRGTLGAPSGRTVPPRVRAILLDAAGDSLGSPIDAHLERLSAEQLTPDALSARISRGFARIEGSSRGFTILIPDPPIEARRFDLILEPRS